MVATTATQLSSVSQSFARVTLALDPLRITNNANPFGGWIQIKEDLPVAFGTLAIASLATPFSHLLICRNLCKKTQGCWRLQQQAVEPECRLARVLGIVTESVRSRQRKRSAPRKVLQFRCLTSCSHRS